MRLADRLNPNGLSHTLRSDTESLSNGSDSFVGSDRTGESSPPITNARTLWDGVSRRPKLSDYTVCPADCQVFEIAQVILRARVCTSTNSRGVEDPTLTPWPETLGSEMIVSRVVGEAWTEAFEFFEEDNRQNNVRDLEIPPSILPPPVCARLVSAISSVLLP